MCKNIIFSQIKPTTWTNEGQASSIWMFLSNKKYALDSTLRLAARFGLFHRAKPKVHNYEGRARCPFRRNRRSSHKSCESQHCELKVVLQRQKELCCNYLDSTRLTKQSICFNLCRVSTRLVLEDFKEGYCEILIRSIPSVCCKHTLVLRGIPE